MSEARVKAFWTLVDHRETLGSLLRIILQTFNFDISGRRGEGKETFSLAITNKPYNTGKVI